MAISGIISISGKPGLYKVVSKSKNGLIAESLNDSKRIPVYASQKVSALEEISIYTYEDDIPLSEVLDKMFEKLGGEVFKDVKSDPKALRSTFAGIIEDFDQDRVYNSDLKKLFQWYNALVNAGLLTAEKSEEEKEEASTDKKAAPKKAAPKAKKATPTAKKSAPKAVARKSAAKSAPRKTGGK